MPIILLFCSAILFFGDVFFCAEDFNFEHILWVFSGRRGIHCWVCDKTARHLDNKNRNAVAEYLNLFTQQNSASRVTIPGGSDRMHHSLKRAHRICDEYFEEICLNDQNVFGTVDGRQKLLELIPDEVRKEIEPEIMAVGDVDSKVVWDFVKRFVDGKRTKKEMQRKVKFLIEEIQMSLLCPRLDISVSKTANHLLKAPFCVHPKTGKVCVPFNPSAVNKFDPTTVPKIRQLLTDIDQFDDKDKEDGLETNRISLVSCLCFRLSKKIRRRISDLICLIFVVVVVVYKQAYRKTAMYKSIQIFEEFLRKLESSFKAGAKLEVSDAKMEF